MKTQEAVRKIFVHDSLLRYVQGLVAETRRLPHATFGASPRGALSLVRAAQALAAIRRASFVTPDHVKNLAAPVLAAWGGQPDGNQHPMVGALFFDFDQDGQITMFDLDCSGSYADVSKDGKNDVFLTAGHCLAFTPFLNYPTAYVSFDNNLTEGISGLIEAKAYTWHPEFGHDAGDLKDLGIVLLPAGSVSGIPQGFFANNMFAGGCGVTRLFQVSVIRRSDVNGVEVERKQSFQRVHRTHAELSGNLGVGVLVSAPDGDQLGVASRQKALGNGRRRAMPPDAITPQRIFRVILELMEMLRILVNWNGAR